MGKGVEKRYSLGKQLFPEAGKLPSVMEKGVEQGDSLGQQRSSPV